MSATEVEVDAMVATQTAVHYAVIRGHHLPDDVTVTTTTELPCAPPTPTNRPPAEAAGTSRDVARPHPTARGRAHHHHQDAGAGRPRATRPARRPAVEDTAPAATDQLRALAPRTAGVVTPVAGPALHPPDAAHHRLEAVVIAADHPHPRSAAVRHHRNASDASPAHGRRIAVLLQARRNLASLQTTSCPVTIVKVGATSPG